MIDPPERVRGGGGRAGAGGHLQESRSSGVQEFRRSGVQRGRSHLAHVSWQVEIIVWQ